MSTETPPAASESESKKRPALRLSILVAALGLAALAGWLLWPSSSDVSPYDLSRADGKPRFYVTTYPKTTIAAPLNLSFRQRLLFAWSEFQRRHRKLNPAAYTFPASPVQPCSIQGLLTQCMEVTGTHYYVAVEIAGGVEFGATNSLSGPQWAAAVEHAIEASGPVVCYDFGKKRNFQDTLLVIRERPGVVKVVPRTRLAEYQKAGLVKARLP